MNIVDFFGGTIETAWIGTRTYAAGRTYAVIQAKTAWSFVEINSTASGGRFRHRETYQHSGSIVSGNQITTNWYTASATDITDDDPGTVLGTQTHKAPEAYFLVVDVT